MSTTPSSTPAEAPKVPTPAPEEKITLEARNKLADLKSKLEIKPDDSSKQKEIEAIKQKFEENKDKILTISKASLESLKKDIHDSDEIITGKLEVKDGELVHTEVVEDSTSTKPETTPTEPVNPETLVNLGDITTQVPESYQKEVKNYIVDNGGFAGMVMKGLSNWVTEIIKGIKGFFATFGIEDEGEKKDALAQINGFEDAEEERRVTASVKALKSSPVTKGPPLSDLLKISHISNEDLTKILKDNPGLDFSSTKNIEAAFTGKYMHSGDREPMRHYDRIFMNLVDIHDNLDPSEPYNATSKFKEILAGSKDTTLDSYIPDTPKQNTTVIPGVMPSSPTPENTPKSSEDLKAAAKDLDMNLKNAEALPYKTEEEIKTREEAVKKAQEKIQEITKKAEEERKRINTSLTLLKKEKTDIENKITNIENKKLTPSDSDYDTSLEEVQKLKSEKNTVDLKITEIGKAVDAVKNMPNTTAEEGYMLIFTIQNIESETEESIQRNLDKPNNVEEIKKELNKIRETFNRKKIVSENINDVNGRKIDSKDVINNGIELLNKYKEDASISATQEYKNLKDVVEYSKAKTDLIIAAIKKKVELKNRGILINFDNSNKITDDTVEKTRGWAEIEENMTTDSIEFDVYDEGDSWSMTNDEHFAWETDGLITPLSGLSNARKILGFNEEIIKTNTDLSAIEYNK